jgi:predicted DNA-binding transcriptional regulator AlpA
MSSRLLNQAQLAARWGISARSLERWRARREGPPFIRLNKRRVLYREQDVEAYEIAQLRLATATGSTRQIGESVP